MAGRWEDDRDCLVAIENYKKPPIRFEALMSTRPTGLAPDHVNALNSIDVVFSARSDQQVRDAWHKVLAHLGTDANAEGWQEKLNDVKVGLFREIGVRVGYDFTTDYLKRQIYLSTYYVNAESELLQIRHALTEALTDDGLKVNLAVPQKTPRQCMHLPSNVARFEQLMYLSLGLAVIETVLERDRFLANSNENVRLLVSVRGMSMALWRCASGRPRENTRTGSMGLADRVCGDISRIPGDWSDFGRGDFARCSVLPHIGRIVLDLHR